MKKISDMGVRLRRAAFLNLGFALAVLIYVILLFFLQISCPIKYLLKIECPTCGITRAWIYILRGDVLASLRMQPMALPLSCVVFLQINKGFFKEKAKTVTDILTVTVVVINFLIYLIR